MYKLLVFNPMTSASTSLTRVEISTTTYFISCKHILTIRQMYTTKMERKAADTTVAKTRMKTTPMMEMPLMNRQKRNTRLGVTETAVLIVISKK